MKLAKKLAHEKMKSLIATGTEIYIIKAKTSEVHTEKARYRRTLLFIIKKIFPALTLNKLIVLGPISRF